MKIKKFTNKKLKSSRRSFIKKIKISNFKSFKENNQIELAPMVNLIFGQNSAGKSSIFQSLRLFRQSYLPGNNLALFNYESPPEYRGKGGLDIDIGYSGIVNEGNLKKSIELGVGVNNINSNPGDSNTAHINYKFKYIPNFYKGKNLIKNKTVPSNINFSSGKDSISIDLTKHIFFKETDKKYFPLKRRLSLFNFNRGSRQALDVNPYGSIYDPFFFEIEINKKNTYLDSLNKIYKDYLKINSSKIIQVFSLIEEELKKKLKNKEQIVEKKFYERKELTKEIEKKIKNEVFRKNLSPQQRIEWFLKNPDFVKYFYDNFRGVYNNEDEKTYSQYLLKKIRNFIKSIKEYNFYQQKVFVNYFFDDIVNESKDFIFFNGSFVKHPKKNKLHQSYFLREGEDTSVYLINILAWLFNKVTEWTDDFYVSIFSNYDSSSGRYFYKPNMDAMLQVDMIMKKMIIVPGLRSMPKRYFVKGMQTNYVGSQAENLAELLANPKIRKEANDWLKKLEIPYDVDIRSSGNYYEIVFKPTKSKINVAQTHIGLGYPLILPLIVQSLISRDKIIVVEEPEVHLHPKIEADLAELIIYSAKNYNNQFLIETHSEEFLLRVLKNIRENNITPKDISINYIRNDRSKSGNKGSVINKILVNKYGQYETPWKDDLFAERRNEYK